MKQLVTRGALLAAVAVLLLAGAAAFSGPGTDQEKPSTWPEALEEYLGTPAYKSVDPDKPLHEQTSVFEMAGRTFEMPTVYIQSNLDGKQEQPDGVNLLYVLPKYTSRGDFANRQEYEQAREERRFGHMLIKPFASWPSSFEIAIANHHHSMEKVERAGTFDGLEVERWYQERQGELRLYHEVYIERDDQGRIVSFIECSTLDRPAVRFPGCNHKFRDGGLLYDIHYNKERYLDDWRAMQASAIAFIESFEVEQ